MVYRDVCNFSRPGMPDAYQTYFHMPYWSAPTGVPVPAIPFRLPRGTPPAGSPVPVIVMSVVFPYVFRPSNTIVSPIYPPPDPR